MSIRKKAFLVFTLFSVLVCSFLPLNVGAVTLTEEVTYQESGTPAYYRFQFSNGADSGWINGYYTNGNTPQNISTMSIRNSSNSNFSSLTNGRYLTFTFRVRFKGVSDKWNTSGAWSINPTDVNCPVIDVTEGDSQYHDLNNLTYTFETLFVTCKYTGTGTVTTNLTIASSQYTTDWQARILNYAVWSREAFATSDDIAAVTSAVNSMKTAINNKLDTTNNKLDTLNISVNDLKAAQEQANQDAQDRYDDEKQNIQDNANQGKEDSESLGEITLSLLNPLNSWKNLFSNGCSVNIPIIAGWLNAPQSSYTSWWCSTSTLSNIKSVLTGVLSIVGVMIVFGFAFKWLRTNQGED